MGILQGIFKARDKPKDSLGGSRYSFFLEAQVLESRLTNIQPCK